MSTATRNSSQNKRMKIPRLLQESQIRAETTITKCGMRPAGSKEQGARSEEQGARSKEQGARSEEQGAEGAGSPFAITPPLPYSVSPCSMRLAPCSYENLSSVQGSAVLL